MEGLTDEEIETLNEIIKLPQEEQKDRLNEFLSKLEPEKIEWLKKQQKQECVFCLISEKKIDSKIVYEDEKFIAALDINPANKGHLIVFPKLHFKDSFELKNDNFQSLFGLINSLSKELKEIVKADGINVLYSNGKAAGQKVEHFNVHIIPRFNDDGINFTWNVSSVSVEENNQIWNELKRIQVQETKLEKKNIEKKDYSLKERIP